jgi:hypothetical protein
LTSLFPLKILGARQYPYLLDLPIHQELLVIFVMLPINRTTSSVSSQ